MRALRGLLAVAGGGVAGGGLGAAVRGLALALNTDANGGYLNLVVFGGVIFGLGCGAIVAALLHD